MKYTEKNPPLVCMMTQSTCYKGTTKGKPVGVLWHDTAGGNPWLSRYVQPDDNAPNRAQMLEILGKNKYNNDFNHITRYAGLNCWVGKLADGRVSTVQTMPWDYRPWGCGSGPKGSCNGTTGGDFWLQFEICDDNYLSGADKREYFEHAYQEACEITAYLCKKFNIDPNGTVNYRGVKVPTILCHQDSYRLGLGSNHADVYMWFNKYGKDMADVRKDVAALLGTSSQEQTPVQPSKPTEPATPATFTVGDLVSVKPGATYYTGKSVPSWVFDKNWYVKSVSGDRVVLGESEDKKANLVSAFKAQDLKKVKAEESFKSYVVRITANALNVRSGPGIDYKVNTVVYKGGVYTIVEEKDGWGKLKSGAGWIKLSYTERKD